jgi:hypothetical protein
LYPCPIDAKRVDHDAGFGRLDDHSKDPRLSYGMFEGKLQAALALECRGQGFDSLRDFRLPANHPCTLARTQRQLATVPLGTHEDGPPHEAMAIALGTKRHDGT